MTDPLSLFQKASAKLISGQISADQREVLQKNALSTPQTTELQKTPIRTIHHLSCTGGTLFAKCLASMHNTLVLNEIDPFSKILVPKGKPPFTPTDIVALARQGDASFVNDALIEKMFLADMAVLREESWLTGRDLILRDHSHSHFLFGELNEEKPTLRDRLQKAFPVKSVVTIREPKNAFASMERYGWNTHFQPSTYEEYCRRHEIFLARFTGLPIFRYEDFTSDPNRIMAEICDVLELSYNPEYEGLFSSFRFSGDSGRGGKRIVHF